MAARIEEIALPKLRKIQTIKDFHNFALEGDCIGGSIRGYLHHQTYIAAAPGDFETALTYIERMTRDFHYWSDLTYRPEHFDELIYKLLPLIATRDRAGIAALPHEWEAFTIH